MAFRPDTPPPPARPPPLVLRATTTALTPTSATGASSKRRRGLFETVATDDADVSGAAQADMCADYMRLGVGNWTEDGLGTLHAEGHAAVVAIDGGFSSAL